MTTRSAFGLFAAVLVGEIYAQNITSSIVGHVTDPSGAPVPGAAITVRNAGSSDLSRTTTDSTGSYSVPALLAGEYDVTAAKDGFQISKAAAVRLYSAQILRIDMQLNVGSMQQEITVSSQAPLVHTDSMGISSSVGTQQLENLPTSLQTVDAFIALAPGVQAFGDATNPPIGGGSHWGSVNFTLNGVGVNDPGNSGAVTVQGVGLLVLPPPSSIQELKVQSNNMTAEYRGHSAVTLVTKAGTNAYHFQLYEYLQNTKLNANSFLLNTLGQPRAPRRLNQFGGNLGGPVIHDRLFFFFDYNGYRHRDSPVTRLNLPGTAMRQGDFSTLCSAFDRNGVCQAGKGTQLYNPFTGQPFPRNRIPSGMITPQAQALLKYLPAPTTPNSPGLPFAASNYISTIPRVQTVNAEDFRADYEAAASDRLFAVWSQRVASPWNSVNAEYPSDYGQGRNRYDNYSASLSDTHTFNASTVNVLRLAWGDYATTFSGQNQDIDPRSFFPQMPESYYRGLPTLSMSGYSGMFHDFGTGFKTPRWDIEITDDFTRVHGSHTIQAGLDETGYKMSSRVPSTGSATGAFSFNGRWTGNLGWPGLAHSNGNSFADFLLGVANSSTTNGVGKFASMVYSRDWGIYVQDTWRASPRLTINFGLRYEYQSPWRYRTRQEVATFDTARSKLVLPQDSLTPTLPPGASSALFAAYPFETTKSIGLPLDYVQPDKNNFAPRVGFAYRPFAGAVIRGGYGVYYNFQPGFVGSRADAWNPPYQLSISQGFSSQLPGNPKQPFLPDITFSNPFPGVNGQSNVSPNPQIYMFQQDFKNAVTQEWNLTLERQWKQNWMTRASYLGSQAHHLPWNFGPINVPLVQTPNVPLQQQRPFQPWGAISATRSGGKQNFEQMQLELIKRLGGGVSLQAEYQFTRSLDDVAISGGPQIWQYPALDYGNSTLVRRHWLVFNYMYQLPLGRDRVFLRKAPAALDAVIGGWQVSGISTYGTGLPFSVSFSQTGTGKVGWWGGRADAVAGAPLYAGKQSDSHDIVRGVPWFNPAAFAPPLTWTWGNSARDMLWGPGLWNWDMSASKTFRMPERLRLSLRADFLDALNHFNLGTPSATIADTRDGGSPVATSGKIFGGSGSRVVQVSLRLSF